MDNGTMIAWTGAEYLRCEAPADGAILPWDDPGLPGLRYIPKWPLGADISADVAAADIPVSLRHLRTITRL